MWIIKGIRDAGTLPPVENGKLTIKAVSVLMGVLFLLIPATMTLRWIVRRDGDDDKEDEA